MEEKERYVIDCCDDLIFDTEKEYYPSGDTICKTLNRQDKRIKELERKILIQLNNNADNVNFMENQRRENQQLKQQLEDYKDICHKHYIDCPDNLDRFLLGMKQQLHDLPKKIVEEIRKLCCIEDKFENGEYLLGLTQKDLDTILKKYGEQ